MQVLIVFLTLFLSQSLLAKPCEVDGISDSPQRLSCQIGGENLLLMCKNGQYFVGDEAVEVAYHEEVEEGPVPLIFKLKTWRLSVLFEKNRILAQSESLSGETLKKGSCRP